MKREYVEYYNEYFIKLKVMKPYEVGNRKIYEKVLIQFKTNDLFIIKFIKKNNVDFKLYLRIFILGKYVKKIKVFKK